MTARFRTVATLFDNSAQLAAAAIAVGTMKCEFGLVNIEILNGRRIACLCCCIFNDMLSRSSLNCIPQRDRIGRRGSCASSGRRIELNLDFAISWICLCVSEVWFVLVVTAR